MKKPYLFAIALLFIASQAWSQIVPVEPSAFRNVLVCGDITSCPNQRGTSTTGIANTGTMTLDYWEAIGVAASNITIASTAITNVPGFSNALSFQRTAANASAVAINVGQVLDTAESVALAGQTVCFSFFGQVTALGGVNGFSSPAGALTGQVISGTGTAQGYTTMTTGWTGAVNVISTVYTMAVLPNRFFTCGNIPSNATEVGVNFQFTPSGTAGTSDLVLLAGIQLEAITTQPGAPIGPTAYEHHPSQVEYQLATRRMYRITEAAAGVNQAQMGIAASATSCLMPVAFPTQMRAAPTFTNTAIVSGTTWQITAAGVAANTTAVVVATANTVLGGSINWTTAGMTAGQACGLQGKGGGAFIQWSADLTDASDYLPANDRAEFPLAA